MVEHRIVAPKVAGSSPVGHPYRSRIGKSKTTIAETVHRGIAGSEWVIFEQSAHVALLEEEDEVRRVLNDFMRRVEGQG